MKCAFGFLFFFTVCFSLAQDDYWQQHVDYKIDVELFPEQDSLSGNLVLTYTNNSPDVLDEIYFHLWINSHSSNETAFAKQLVEHGDKSFYTASEVERGRVSGLNFTVEPLGDVGEGSVFQPEAIINSNEPDIVKLTLPNGVLAPGKQVKIETPFEVRLPFLYSRPGTDGEVFHLTQWFPKPAVYDSSGWHPMPYLDMGEYYAEYGNFEVNITVPANYTVAATGELQNEEEIQRLTALEAATRQGIKDNYDFSEVNALSARLSGKKTLTYLQNNIHDFAWFASDKFLYLQKPVLIGQQTVSARAFFLEDDVYLWEKAPNYVQLGLGFYSEKVGHYPYSHCTAVGGALQAGGGMEYPMVTIIAPTDNDIALKTVIVHEVGHNWFQAMLGSNERTTPWLDEGINSFYEEWALAEEIGLKELKFEFMKLAFSLFNSRHTNQPINEQSQNYIPNNYGVDVYGAGAFAMHYLQQYLGQQAFDKGMQAYFEQWKFKHPNNQALQNSLEQASGKNLSWFFQKLIQSPQSFDYKVQRINANELVVLNKSDIPAPFTLSYLNNADEVIAEEWHEGFTGEQAIPLSVPITDFAKAKIFNTELFPEINRQNNAIKTSGLFPKNEAIKLVGPKSSQAILAGKSDNPQLYLAPGVFWNATDQLILGAVASNTFLIEKPFEYTLASGYGFGSDDVVGLGEARYTFFPQNGPFQHIRPSIRARHFNYTSAFETNQDYYQATPNLEFAFKKPEARSSVQKTLSLQSRINFIEPQPSFDVNTGTVTLRDKETEVFNTLEFKRANNRPFNPNTARLWVEQNENFGKLSGEYKYRYDFENERRHLWFRAFAGTMLFTEDGAPTVSRFTAMSRYNNTDYALENIQFDRTGSVYSGQRFFYETVETNNLQNNWIRESDGGLKMKRFSANLSEVVGDWMAATNISASVPVDLPIGDLRVFGDIAVFQDLGLSGPEETRALYDLGLSFGLEDYVRLYYPLAFSDEFKPDVGELTFSDKLTFSLQANPLDIKEKVRGLF